MLPQRILARRLPLGAVYRTVPRASFSQMRALAAAEANDSLAVLCTRVISTRFQVY